uniref:GST N-terminal domain-containing protein n=1 Tax=Coccolithus braarudii TaxID=221442 RepID=A0A7S0LIK9_9EUKA|mmetsp:Transcript_42037/g.89761  ORF Transcript_42037/g.89761 Transcript_42037/m.89761 type:complete len:482 (+) Transcript_42037:12-1457(+)
MSTVLVVFATTAAALAPNLGGMLSTLLGGAGTPMATPIKDAAPSLDDLAESLRDSSTEDEIAFRSRLADGTLPHASALAKVRLFDGTRKDAERVTLYRDTAAWCPYCEKVWLMLEEKRVPYTVEKVNMNCYGEKPAWFWAMQPSGGIPVAKIDGQVIRESNDIIMAIENTFDGKPMLPVDEEEAAAVQPLLGLERQIFSCWFRWLTSGSNDGALRIQFVALMAEVDDALATRGGPYFLGADTSLVDCMFAPFLERMAASVLYYKGLAVRTNGDWPNVVRWFEAMEERPSYRHICSDFYTHAHDLPPQIGRCQLTKEAERYAAAIDGLAASWQIPLPQAGHEAIYEPIDHLGQDDDSARREAAERLLANWKAVSRFSARGVGKRGFPPVSAPLSDPNAGVGENLLPQVDIALRHVVQSLLQGELAPAELSDGLAVEVVTPSLGYLRDRVSVPRDMGYPAARQLRAHLNSVIKGVAQKQATST